MRDVEIRTRDYAAEMRRRIDEKRVGSYNATVIAHEIVNDLLAGDRELLYGWLQGHAVDSIRRTVAEADAFTRSYARRPRNAPLSLFAEAVKSAEGGDSEPLRRGFLQAVFVVDDADTRMALRDMRANDVLYVADMYDARGQAALMEAAFLKAVAKKVGRNRRVSDVFNNVQLDELRETITGR